MDLPTDYTELTPYMRRKVREEYVRLQHGYCHFCDQPLNGACRKDIADKRVNRNLFPQGFFTHPIHLHHCHNTGMTIGAVHCYCNAVMWEYCGE